MTEQNWSSRTEEDFALLETTCDSWRHRTSAAEAECLRLRADLHSAKACASEQSAGFAKLLAERDAEIERLRAGVENGRQNPSRLDIVICGHCDGAGWFTRGCTAKCLECNGTGRITT